MLKVTIPDNVEPDADGLAHYKTITGAEQVEFYRDEDGDAWVKCYF